jgi:hypothetical protein
VVNIAAVGCFFEAEVVSEGGYLRVLGFICGNLILFASFGEYLRVSVFICDFQDIFATPPSCESMLQTGY